MSGCPLKSGMVCRALRGEAGGEELNLIKKHLMNPCPDCEGTVLGLPAEQEKLLIKFLYFPEDAAVPLTREEKDGIFSSVSHYCAPEEKTVDPSYPRASGERRRSRAFALAAMALLAIGLPLLAYHLYQPDQYDGIKDGAVAPEGGVFLQFIVLHEASDPEGKPSLARGHNHGRYPSDSRLLFRFQLDSPGRLYIVRSDASGKTEVIFPSGESAEVKQPGFYDAASNGELLAYPLSGRSGPQTFCAAVLPLGPGPGAEAAVEYVKKETDRHQSQPGPGRLRHQRIDCFEIRVEE